MLLLPALHYSLAPSLSFTNAITAIATTSVGAIVVIVVVKVEVSTRHAAMPMVAADATMNSTSTLSRTLQCFIKI